MEINYHEKNGEGILNIKLTKKELRSLKKGMSPVDIVSYEKVCRHIDFDNTIFVSIDIK